MTDLQITNEDDRRILYDFPEGKLLDIKKDCIIGDHYHKIKTEYFVLLNGVCEMNINGNIQPMDVGTLYTVLPFENHIFKIKKNSVLIGLCTHPYDPKDDYKLC